MAIENVHGSAVPQSSRRFSRQVKTVSLKLEQSACFGPVSGNYQKLSRVLQQHSGRVWFTPPEPPKIQNISMG